jgi:hypothetical protein
MAHIHSRSRTYRNRERSNIVWQSMTSVRQPSHHVNGREILTANRRVLGDVLLCLRTGEELKGVPGRVLAYDFQRA